MACSCSCTFSLLASRSSLLQLAARGPAAELAFLSRPWIRLQTQPAAQVFEMFALVSLPSGDAEGCPPAVLPAGWRSVYQARQRSANVVIVLAKIAPQVRHGLGS